MRDDLEAVLEAVGKAREAHEVAAQRLAELRTVLVRYMHSQGTPMEEIGRVLGLTRQRVSQILKPKRRGAERAHR